MHLTAVQGERELRLLRHGVGHRRLEVGHGAEQALAALGPAHDDGVITRSGHDGETEALAVHADLAHVEIKGLPGAHNLCKRMGLERACKVQGQQIGRACGEGQHGYTGVGQQVAHRGHGAVAARRDHGIEVLRIVEQRAYRGGAVGAAHADVVAVGGEAAHEIVDGAFAVSRCQVVDDKQFHGFPFRCGILTS